MVLCLRCEEKLEFQGTERFQLSNPMPMAGGFGEVFVPQFSASIYICPSCGHMEFFHTKVGLEKRQSGD